MWSLGPDRRLAADGRRTFRSYGPRGGLGEGISLSVNKALALVIAFETSKYLSLVSAIELVRTSSDERGRLAAIGTRRLSVTPKFRNFCS